MGIAVILATAAGDELDLRAWVDPTAPTALAGLSGFGLPPVDVQWTEGVTDGATLANVRVKPRDIDLPLAIFANDRADLKARLERLTPALTQEATLKLADPATSETWSAAVIRIGGGDAALGIDTDAETYWQTVVTLRAGRPFWIRDSAEQFTITPGGAGRSLLPRLANLRLSSSQALGTRDVTNPGNATAYPTWIINGPGTTFAAIDEDGNTLEWEGTLEEGDTLTIDTAEGTVTDQTGADRYDGITSPTMWLLRPGLSTVTVALDGAVAGQSSVVCTYRPRRWIVL